MWFLLLGLLGVALKYFGIPPVAVLSWWILLIPFALALAWWDFADAFGYTKGREMAREEHRKQVRIDRQRVHLGMLPRTGRPGARDKR